MQYAILLKNNKEYVIEAERYNECDESFLRFYDKNGREMAFYNGYVNFSVFTEYRKIILTDKEQTDVR